MSNLPPGTTNADIDDHFGGEEVILSADVTIGVQATAFRDDSEDRKEEQLLEAIKDGEWEDVVEITIVEEERK
jgi:hypothetical protein